MIVEGNAPLAAAYAANIIAIYQSYRWNAYVEAHRQDPKVWHGLIDKDDWQDDYLAGDELAELTFWMGAYRPAATSSAPPPPLQHVPAGPPPAASPAPAAATPSRGPRRRHPARIAAARKQRATKTSSPTKKQAAKKRPVKAKKARKG
jgi:hypothetical protein